MTIKELRALTLLIQYGTVSQVADILGMTQPGVSRILKSLENKTHRKLFYRHNNKLIPTKYALQFAEHATPVLEDFDALNDTFVYDETPDASVMKIVAPNVFSMLLSIVLQKMHASATPTSINLSTTSSVQVIEKMTHQHYHLGGIAHNTPIAGNVHITPICYSPVQCIVHARSPLATTHTPITPAHLKNHKIIHAFHHNSSETKQINRILRHIRTQSVPFYSVDTYMACQLVASNLGVALLADVTAQILARTNANIRIVPFSETLYQSLQWVTPSRQAPHPNTEKIMQLTQQVVQQYSPQSTLSV